LVNISRVISGVSRLKFTQVLLFSAELTMFNNAVYRLSIYVSSPEIFAVKLESCLKLTKFWTSFALPNFKGGGTSKSCTCVNSPT